MFFSFFVNLHNTVEGRKLITLQYIHYIVDTQYTLFITIDRFILQKKLGTTID